MKNTRFIKIISTFSPAEFKEFGKFVKSPFFNSNKALIKLYAYLKKYYPEFSPRYLEEKIVYKKLFSNRNFNTKRMRDISHEMLKLCEKFLAYKGFNLDPFNENIYLLKELNPRNIPSIFQHYYKTIDEFLLKEQLGYDTYSNKNILDKELLKFYNTYSLEKAKDIMQPAIDNGIKSCIFELLRCFVGLYSANHVLRNSLNFRLEDEIIEYLEINEFLNDPLLEIYYHMVTICQRKDDESYLAVKKIYSKYKSLFKDEIKKEIYLALHNYLFVYKNGIRDGSNIKEIFTIQSNMIYDKIYEDNNGFILSNFFYNYINTLFRLKKYYEAEKFINKNRYKLNIVNREDYIIFLYGQLYVKTGRFNEALKQFNELTKKDKELLIDSKCIMAICHYELGNYDELFKVLDSIQHSINRNSFKIRREHYNEIKLFLKFFNVFISYRQNKLKISKLKKDINNVNNFMNRQWLLTKIDELEKAKTN